MVFEGLGCVLLFVGAGEDRLFFDVMNYFNV